MSADDGYIVYRDLEDGRRVGVIPILFGRARLVITEPHERLCYADVW